MRQPNLYFGKDRKELNKLYGVETFEQIEERVQSFLGEIRENYPEKRILLVSHGGLCKIMIYCLEKVFPETIIGNCEAKKYEIIGNEIMKIEE